MFASKGLWFWKVSMLDMVAHEKQPSNGRTKKRRRAFFFLRVRGKFTHSLHAASEHPL